jgi:predicted DCC family thiol-disulfide oxidoreductase YuxK
VCSSDLTCPAPQGDGLTVYFDGSCPLCRAEIDHYRNSRGAEAIAFRDVADPAFEPPPDLTRDAAMARFHVRRADGALASGAAAFTELWLRLPAWRPLGRIAALPGVRRALEIEAQFGIPRSRLISPRLADLVDLPGEGA